MISKHSDTIILYAAGVLATLFSNGYALVCVCAIHAISKGISRWLDQEQKKLLLQPIYERLSAMEAISTDWKDSSDRVKNLETALTALQNRSPSLRQGFFP